ncbi:hypothetical protein [Kibdelosporangium banguiense]|uniref:hypothetical protein n=1 Tax=Kibdelosporangium banguiense TaxID=1365924 RepID=UPI001AE60554|nr:hypothetical protein [Kibdelosporangium banguiense]
MRFWLTRGFVLAFVLAGADVGLAAIAVHTSSLSVIRSIVLGVVAGAAALWAALDGWHQLADRGRIWVLAAVIAGFASGLLRVIGKAIFVDETGLSSLGSALTGDAAFGALVILVPAGLGLLVGSRIAAQRGTSQAGTSQGDAQRTTAKAGPRK